MKSCKGPLSVMPSTPPSSINLFILHKTRVKHQTSYGMNICFLVDAYKLLVMRSRTLNCCTSRLLCKDGYQKRDKENERNSTR